MGKSYALYLSSLVLFGLNGIVAAAIALPSGDIVLARTFLGALMLGVLMLVGTLARTCRKRLHDDTRAAFHSEPSQSAGAVAVTVNTATSGARHFRFPFHMHKALAVALGLYALSGAALGASWISLFEAYRLVGVGTASLAYYCGPVIVMALSPLLFKERLSAFKVLGFAAVALGAVLVSTQALQGGQDPWGLALGGVSALLYSVMIVCTKKAGQVLPGVEAEGLRNSFVQLASGFAVVALFTATTQGAGALLVPAAPSDIAPLLVLGLVNTGIGCFMYFSSIGQLPVQTVAVCGYLEPLSAVVFSVLLLGEPLTAVQFAGAALIVGGACFSELAGKRTGKPLFSVKRRTGSHQLRQVMSE